MAKIKLRCPGFNLAVVRALVVFLFIWLKMELERKKVEINRMCVLQKSKSLHYGEWERQEIKRQPDLDSLT